MSYKKVSDRFEYGEYKKQDTDVAVGLWLFVAAISFSLLVLISYPIVMSL